MSTKSHSHKRSGTLRKKNLPQGGMVKFTCKGRFLTIKIAYENSWIENPNIGNML
jgi:hypothetical protein